MGGTGDMTISVHKTGADAFAVTIGDTRVTLNASDLRALLLEITQVLLPGANPGASPRHQASDLLARLKRASDIGLQALIRTVHHDDVLVLLKIGERDEVLRRKLYANMSERKRKMCVEDMLFKFKDGVAEDLVGETMGRLGRAAANLEVDGHLTYE